MIPNNLPDQIVDIYGRLGEIERRARNRKRTGIIEEVDTEKGLYRVKFGEVEGKPFLSGWIKAKTLGAGNVKIDVLHSKGEQVDVVSESGDLTDAVIDLATYSDSNARENSTTPLHMKIGSTILEVSGDAVTLTAGTINFKGNVNVEGNVSIEGDIVSTGTVTNNGKDIGSTHTNATLPVD